MFFCRSAGCGRRFKAANSSVVFSLLLLHLVSSSCVHMTHTYITSRGIYICRVDAKLLEDVQEYDAVPSDAASYGKTTFWDERYAVDEEVGVQYTLNFNSKTAVYSVNMKTELVFVQLLLLPPPCPEHG